MFRATAARAQSKTSSATLFDIEKIADGAWAAVAKPATLTNCNAAVFEMQEGLLVVDTHSKPSAVAALVGQIRKEISAKPVRFVVNSHFHWDHTQGANQYRKMWPKSETIASETTRRLLSENAVQRLKESMDTAAQSLDGYKKQLNAASSGEAKAQWQRMISDTEGYLAEMKNYAPLLPDITLETDLILHDKTQDLHLAFRGKGHTAGDVVVYSPQRKVVATGDLLHSFPPFFGDGYPLEWPRTLLKVAEFDYTHAIGGHASVHQGKDRLYQMSNFIEEITEGVVRGKEKKKSAATLQQELTPASLKTLQGDYGKFLLESTRRYRAMAPGVTPAAALAAGIQAGVGHIYSALDRS